MHLGIFFFCCWRCCVLWWMDAVYLHIGAANGCAWGLLFKASSRALGVPISISISVVPTCFILLGDEEEQATRALAPRKGE